MDFKKVVSAFLRSNASAKSFRSKAEAGLRFVSFVRTTSSLK
jgi:hypothetical protein